MKIDSEECNFNSSKECEIISFLPEVQEEVSQEEIGKLVDKLMKMPDSENVFSKDSEEFSENFSDPFIKVAERILLEESF